MAASIPLSAVVRAAKLPPADVTKALYATHGITSVEQLKAFLADADAARDLPPQWREKLHGAVQKLTAAAGISPVQWRPNGADARPRIVVLQGDLTECPADAIVNAANSRLSHGGGLAGAIAKRGGRVITEESAAWIREHKTLPEGNAMVTSSGKLPCRFVIHTVGPRIGGRRTPTAAEAQQLRNAVWSVLCEAETLQVQTIAIPGISSGIFGYPRDLAAREILSECVRFCRERSGETLTTTLSTIALMNNDTPTCESFVKAIKNVAGDALEKLEDDPFVIDESAAIVVPPEPPLKTTEQQAVYEGDLADALNQVRL